MKVSQYRPITVPSNLLRLITVRMARRMMEVAENNGMLGPEQFGFRKKRGTLDAIFVLSSLIEKAKEKSTPYAIAFLDISKVEQYKIFSFTLHFKAQ